MASLSAQSCNGCHAEIHDQWAASGHATASTNPVYLAAVRAMGNPPECQNCHLPLENQRPSLHFGPGSTGPKSDNPSYSPTLAIEGVTCAACHVRDGIIYGPRELHSSESPHPVAPADELREATACAFCHQVSLQGAEEQNTARRDVLNVHRYACTELINLNRLDARSTLLLLRFVL